MIKYRFPKEIPDDLPPGKHATKILDAHWEGEDMVIYLALTGGAPDDCLIPIIKDEPKEKR